MVVKRMWIVFFIIPLIISLIVRWAFDSKTSCLVWIKTARFWLTALCCTVVSLALQCILYMSFDAFLSFSLLKLISVCICAMGFHGILLGIQYVRQRKSPWAMLLLACVVAVFLEGTVFNFRFYQSYEYEAIDRSNEYSLSKGLVATGDRENEYYINGYNQYIDFYDLYLKIHNIYFDVTARNAND